MANFLKKLTSRKFWMSLAGVVTGIAMILGAETNEINTVAGAVMSLVSIITYVITEGKVDAANKTVIEVTEDEANKESIGF